MVGTRTPLSERAPRPGARNMKSVVVSAEVAGTVWQIVVAVGDMVQADRGLVIIESMKMEIPTAATRCGVVRKILVEPGQAVAEGQARVLLERV
jgi:biotin carboxyl carrier protein